MRSGVRPNLCGANRRGPARCALGVGPFIVSLLVGVPSLSAQEAARDAERPLNFENRILPILSKLGCNSGGCHGKAEGQNGFKLSVFGFDPQADYDAITKEARGRRVAPAAPEYSLLLRKATAQMPHGGGKRMDTNSREHQVLLNWIRSGMPFGSSADPVVIRIEVSPHQATLGFATRQPLSVTAIFSDESREDVTALANYTSNAPGVASVDELGAIESHDVPGEAAVMVSYLGRVASARVVIPRRLSQPFDRPAVQNFIDRFAWDKLEQLGIQPSPAASDEEFLRRVFLDVIGTLPTADEARQFYADARPDKRSRWIDQLLERPEYVDLWSLKWADILRVDRQQLKAKGAYAFYEWLRQSVRDNKPYGEFVREIVTVQGPSDRVGPANLYRVLSTPEQLASTISQVFLGIRIECAQCHHHPFDKWGQDDFYGMVGFFSRVQRRADGEGIDVAVGPVAEVKHPRTGQPVPVHALETAASRDTRTATPQELIGADPRRDLAQWMTGPENRWFYRAIVNRMWSHFFAQGLVEPIDDMRDTSPASNEPLLAALAEHLKNERGDLKQLIRAITQSQVYQLSSMTNPSNEADTRNFSHMALKSIPAEVLLDAISQATGRAEEFELMPTGTRAIQLWDNRVNHYFLQVFGRPLRATACECERMNEPSVAQVLHLMNSPEIQSKVSHPRGRVAQLVRQGRTSGEIVSELYLATYSRPPSEPELASAVGYLDAATSDGRRAAAAEDILWTLLNTTEFLFNR
jgi:hypothetical protein